MKTNFLGQLKQLQELLKESMLDAVEKDDYDDGALDEVIKVPEPAADTNSIPMKKQELALPAPKMRKGFSEHSK